MMKKINLQGMSIDVKIGIIIRLIYCIYYVENKNEFYKNIYYKYQKYGNGLFEDKKRTFEDFELSFQKMIDSFKNEGFNQMYPIPLYKNKIPQNGCHRIACCIYFKQEPYIEKLDYEIIPKKIFDINKYLKKIFFTKDEIILIRRYFNTVYSEDLSIDISLYKKHYQCVDNLKMYIRYITIRMHNLFFYYMENLGIIKFINKIGIYKNLSFVWRKYILKNL